MAYVTYVGDKTSPDTITINQEDGNDSATLVKGAKTDAPEWLVEQVKGDKRFSGSGKKKAAKKAVKRKAKRK